MKGLTGQKEELIGIIEREPNCQEDPMAVFLYALKAAETRRQYPRRLKVFFDFLDLEEPLEKQAKDFLSKAKRDPQWAQSSFMQFIAFQKERARGGEISYSTISNYYKATKLFVEMNTDTPIINWKKTSQLTSSTDLAILDIFKQSLTFLEVFQTESAVALAISSSTLY